MSGEQPERGLQLVAVTDEGVRGALRKIDEMSDSELRELARGEPAMFVAAVEGIIARRNSTEHS